MSQTYIFNESGSIPGIPGTYAHCRVTVMDDGHMLIGPLVDFTPSGASAIPDVPSDAEVSPPPPTEPSAIVPEQVTPPVLALNLNGG